MARAQSSFAISAAFCSMATMVRPESSAMMFGSGWLLGANGTTVAGLSVITYPLTYSHTFAPEGPHGRTLPQSLRHESEIFRRACRGCAAGPTQLAARRDFDVTASTFSGFRH